MRQAGKGRKKFQSRIPLILDPGKRIPKKRAKKFKKQKNLFPALFLAKTGWDRPRKGKKILVPNSVHTRPRQENSKKNSKKIKKTKKNLFPTIFLSKTGSDRLRKEKKNLVPNSVHTRPGQKNSEKNSKIIQNYKKPLSGIIYS